MSVKLILYIADLISKVFISIFIILFGVGIMYWSIMGLISYRKSEILSSFVNYTVSSAVLIFGFGLLHYSLQSIISRLKQLKIYNYKIK